jgi:hypothetical protein
MSLKDMLGPLILLVLVGASPAIAADFPREPRLHAEPIDLGTTWDGPQFVRADKAGNVFVLRGDEPLVYPVGKTGEVGKPARLQATTEALGTVLNAALSPAGDQWLVHAEGKVRLFVDGKEKPLPPLSWVPWTVGFQRGTPVVGVMPRPLPSAVLRLQDMGNVPWFLTLDNDRWSSLREHSGLTAEAAWKERDRMNAWVAEYASWLAPARDGKLWVASQYGYRLRRLSPMGKSLLEITAGKEKKKGAAAEPVPREAATAVRQMEERGGKARFQAFTEKEVIADVVEGSDRAIYLLVHTSEDSALALDRYDPVRNVLERVPLSLKATGRLSLAAGKDGLYMAPFSATKGVWRISWTDLESAVWKEVEEAEIHAGASQ